MNEEPVDAGTLFKPLVCPKCGKEFKLVRYETIGPVPCYYDGDRTVYVKCPHCEYEEEF